MATSTSTSTKKSSVNAASEARRQTLRSYIKAHLASPYFQGTTFAKQDDLENIFMSLMFKESSFNANARGRMVSTGPDTGGADYLASPAVQAILKDPNTTPQHRTNLSSGLLGMGLVQSMGWNHIRGGSKKTGKCLLETIAAKKDNGQVIIDQLCLPASALANTRLEDFLLGEANMSKMVLAGLLILESKWNACKQHKNGWQIGSYVYPLHISAAVSGYLGTGKADSLGTTPGAYTAAIVGGSTYAAANGSSAPNIRDSSAQYASASGPALPVSTTGQASPTGCVVSEKPA